VTLIASEREELNISSLEPLYKYLHSANTESTFIFRKMESGFRAENRFRYYHYYFYIGGVPLFSTSVSSFYRISILLCSICFYSTILAMCMGLYNYGEDVEQVMDVAIFFIVFSGAGFTQLYFG
jgi:hypothetical protein